MTVLMSLSPRPLRPSRTISSFGRVGANFARYAIACDGSSAGMIPSVSLSSRKPASASLSVTATYSARPVSL
jgi:hypothetical protein